MSVRVQPEGCRQQGVYCEVRCCMASAISRQRSVRVWSVVARTRLRRGTSGAWPTTRSRSGSRGVRRSERGPESPTRIARPA